MNKETVYLSIIYLSIQIYSIKICTHIKSEWEIIFHVFNKLTNKKKKISDICVDLNNIIKSIQTHIYIQIENICYF